MSSTTENRTGESGAATLRKLGPQHRALRKAIPEIRARVKN